MQINIFNNTLILLLAYTNSFICTNKGAILDDGSLNERKVLLTIRVLPN